MSLHCKECGSQDLIEIVDEELGPPETQCMSCGYVMGPLMLAAFIQGTRPNLEWFTVCGEAQEMWELMRDEFGWYEEPTLFSTMIGSYRLWERHHLMEAYT